MYIVVDLVKRGVLNLADDMTAMIIINNCVTMSALFVTPMKGRQIV